MEEKILYETKDRAIIMPAEAEIGRLSVSIGPKWSKMVQNGPKWSKMVQNGPKWSKMVQMVKHGQKWSKWSNMVKKNGQNGPKW